MNKMTLKKNSSIALLIALVFVLGISTVPTETYAAGKIKARIAQYVQKHPQAAAAAVQRVAQNNQAARAAVSQYIVEHPNAVENIQSSPALQSKLINYIEDNTPVSAAAILPIWQEIVAEDASNDSRVNSSDNIDTEKSSSVNDTSQACPFSPAANRTIVSFNKSLVWGKGADKTESYKSVNLPAGNYRVYSFAYDGYPDRNTVSQGDESFFVEFRSGSNMIARSSPTPDLADRVASARWSGLVDSSLNVSQSINTIVARHSNYIQAGGARDSVTAGCVAIDLIDTPPADNLHGSCSVNPSTVNVGGTLNWSATATGGNGQYSYTWYGTDGLVGYSSAVSKSYNSSGTKTGTVTIQSNGQSVSYTCSAAVQSQVNNDLSVSCDADDSVIDIDEETTFRAIANGGNGSYSYDWSGTNGLDGSSRNITWSYGSTGTKTANITVHSNGQTATASCHVRVRDNNDNDDLNVSCYANPTNPRIGSRMNWYVNVEGGNGSYSYDWSGTDGLDSSSRSPSMTYDYAGTKTATVRVRSNGQSDTATCHAYVGQNTVLSYSQSNPNNQVLDAVYLSQVPYTGLADNMGVIWFALGLALFSAWIAYIVISYKKQVGELE